VLLIEVAFALTSASTQPYINELVRGLDITGGDEREVGYYVGIIESSYGVAFTLTVLQWSRLSDYIGKKPVLSMGLAGSILTILCFGLSRTFWEYVAAQCLWGLLDGYIAVVKSVVGEITDSSNRAISFSLIFVLWTVGGSVGSIIGGSLARPSDRFPGLFSGDFWKRYPYFLPCFVVSIILAITFLVTRIFFKETVYKKSSSFDAQALEEDSLLLSPQEEPVSHRELLTYPVIIAILNFLTLDFLNTCQSVLQPLFFSMPVDVGGVGLDTVHIGYILGGYRAFIAFFMATACPRIIQAYGEQYAFIAAIYGILVSMVLFPIIAFSARHFGLSTSVWIAIGFWAIPMAFTQMGFTCVFIFITAATPNKRSMGATNGLAQMIVSAARIMAPVISTSLFSFSLKHNILGGYGVYAVFFVLSCFASSIALRLPRRPRPIWEVSD